ncbi:MAG: IS110 family transposase [Rhizobiaceae bacterium]|nr:MAG: IS110 family transposase [Rhizobiaceae bacterium]
MWNKVVDSILGALAEQTVSVPGAAQADVVIKHLAGQLLDVRAARRDLAAHFEQALTEHPAGAILSSLPGVGVRTGVTMLVEITDIGRFRDAGALAVYAGVAPRTHRSGTSIKGEHRQHSGNSRLKRAMYLSAFAALKDPVSRAYYDRKRAEGKNHRSALICLARRRSDVLHAMLRSKTCYRPLTYQASGGSDTHDRIDAA